MRRFFPVLVLGLSLPMAAQQTAGTRAADDTSRENAASERISAAESSLEKGDFAAAVKLLEALSTEHPKDARVLYDLGFAQEQLDHDYLAADAYAKAIAADGTLAEPKVALGLLDARAGRAEKAHAELSGVASDTNASPALRGRALRALAQLDSENKPADAREELLEAIKLTGEQPSDAALSAHIAERSGDSGDAQTIYAKQLARNPGDADAAVGMARALKAEGKVAEAEHVLVTARNASPANGHDARLVAQLVAVYAAEGKDAEAMPLLEGLRHDDPTAAKDPILTEMLARMYAMNGREADAEALDRQLLQVEPNDPALLDALGGVLVKEGKNEEAVKVLSQAAGQRVAFHDDQAWGETVNHLAFAASRAHQPELVLQALAQRATVLPDSPTSHFLAATAHDTLHHKKQAIDEYKAFLAAAGGKFPDEEFEARHRIIALEHER